MRDNMLCGDKHWKLYVSKRIKNAMQLNMNKIERIKFIQPFP